MSMRLIREMRERSEDEIEVLGSARRENDSRKWLWIGAALLFVLVLGFCVWKLFFIRPVEEEGTLLEEPAPEISVADSTSLAGDERPCVTFEKDSINDVVLAIYALHQLKAELSLALPDTSDTSVYFVLQAADIRRDNLQILGDFVLRGKQQARGKRKTGFCAIRNGQITLGNSASDVMKDDCVACQGDFFRQYPLVMEGEVIVNGLKGKALRRALAQRGNDFYIVTTPNRESLYDFSEALADYGFTNALYLVGGISYGWCRMDARVHELGVRRGKPLPSHNYLVFRSAISLE